MSSLWAVEAQLMPDPPLMTNAPSELDVGWIVNVPSMADLPSDDAQPTVNVQLISAEQWTAETLVITKMPSMTELPSTAEMLPLVEMPPIADVPSATGTLPMDHLQSIHDMPSMVAVQWVVDALPVANESSMPNLPSMPELLLTDLPSKADVP